MTRCNNHEKYDSKNPIAQKLINGFMLSITDLVKAIPTPIHSVTECGCGQGHVNQHIEFLLPNAKVQGFDINLNDLNIAKERKIRVETNLYQKSIYDLSENDSGDLIVCCEVLEHLENPDLALKKMANLNAPYYLFSVPNEPIWRILNFIRGKYIKGWGNTPDHCNHWSTKQFTSFVSKELDIIEVKKPFPWSMILAKSKS